MQVVVPIDDGTYVDKLHGTILLIGYNKKKVTSQTHKSEDVLKSVPLRNVFASEPAYK